MNILNRDYLGGGGKYPNNNNNNKIETCISFYVRRSKNVIKLVYILLMDKRNIRD